MKPDGEAGGSPQVSLPGGQRAGTAALLRSEAVPVARRAAIRTLRSMWEWATDPENTWGAVAVSWASFAVAAAVFAVVGGWIVWVLWILFVGMLMYQRRSARQDS